MADRAVATRNNFSLAFDRLPEELRIAKDVYSRDLTDTEFMVLVADSRSRGLSIVEREVIGLKMGGKLTPFVTIGGLRKLAEQSGKLSHVDGPYWCGPDGKWLDVWLKNEPPAAARFSVYRFDSPHPIHGVAKFSERVQPNSPTWKSMPTLMIGKCAESDAYKRARLVPDDIHVSIADEDYDPRRAKIGAMRYAHQVGRERGLGHEEVRSVLRAIRPGIDSMTDETVTSRDLLAAADYIQTVDDDALRTVVETEAFPEFVSPFESLGDYALTLGWTSESAILLALSMHPKDENGKLRTSVEDLTEEQVSEVYEQIEGIGSVIDTETDSDEATPEVEMANRIASAESKSDLNALKMEMKESGISPDWLQTMWKRASLTTKADPKPASTEPEQPELISTPSNQLTN